mgnify:CR=1 FL=1
MKRAEESSLCQGLRQAIMTASLCRTRNLKKFQFRSERKERMLNEQINEITYAIDDMKERNGERWTVKQMESQKKKAGGTA